jgi:putative addiction module antidote
MLLSIKKRGNSLSVIVPKEMADSMNVDDGDRLFATKTPLGYEISVYDPSFEKKIEAARRGMNKYRNALVELAKRSSLAGLIVMMFALSTVKSWQSRVAMLAS